MDHPALLGVQLALSEQKNKKLENSGGTPVTGKSHRQLENRQIEDWQS